MKINWGLTYETYFSFVHPEATDYGDGTCATGLQEKRNFA